MLSTIPKSTEMAVVPFVSILFIIVGYSQQENCHSRDYNQGSTVCICDSDHCDTIPKPEKIDRAQYLTYTSNKAGLRFKKEIGKFATSENSNNRIRINLDEKYQSIVGWGGAFTDSTGINIASLEEELQDKLLRSYFSDDGLEYSLCRVPMGGTDFSTRAYSYDDGDVDKDLNNFALVQEDYLYKIPYMKKGLSLTGNKLKFFASAWMAPKWMKTNGKYDGIGFIKKEMFQAWANYFVKFLDKYREQGIEFWGVTTGNEPMLIVFVKAITVGWSPCAMGEWIENNLGPAVKASNHSEIKIMILDDDVINLPWFVDQALEKPTASKYIDGIAVHWYFKSLTSAPRVLTETHDHFPEKFILSTEACNASGKPVILGSWERGEAYSFDIIEDLQNWVGGWIDWNMVLDEGGGPSYFGTRADSPIIVNSTAGEFYKQPMFYHLGHFSKFIPVDSIRIGTSSDLPTKVMVVALQRPDDAIVVVILNQKEEAFQVSVVDGRGVANIELSGKSITTILYW